jgi:hypothetical protein
MFDDGVNEIYCHFRLPEVQDISTLSATCHRDGELLMELPGEMFDGEVTDGVAVGHVVVEPAADQGFAPGIYEMTITAADGTEHTASFAVVEDAEKLQESAGKTVRINTAEICTEIAEDGSPVNPMESVRASAERIYCVFRYEGGAAGVGLEVAWSAGGVELPQSPQTVTLPSAEGWAHAWLGAKEGGSLPSGKYLVTVRRQPEAQPLATVEFEVIAGD